MEVLIRWLSVGQEAGLRRMGADSGGSHSPQLGALWSAPLPVDSRCESRMLARPLSARALSLSSSRSLSLSPACPPSLPLRYLTTFRASMMSSSGCQGPVIKGQRHNKLLLQYPCLFSPDYLQFIGPRDVTRPVLCME